MSANLFAARRFGAARASLRVESSPVPHAARGAAGGSCAVRCRPCVRLRPRGRKRHRMAFAQQEHCRRSREHVCDRHSLEGRGGLRPEQRAPDGSDILTPRGSEDGFVAKYAPDNSLVWARRMGGDFVWGTVNANDPRDSAGGIAVDGSGSVYVTGNFVGQADFGPFTLTSAGNSDAFVAKLDANGNFVWANRAGTAAKDSGNGVAVDASGNVLAARTTAIVYSNGSYTINGMEIQKYSPAGANVWTKQINSYGMCAGGVATDAAGNVYVIGGFTGKVDFNPDPKKTNYATGSSTVGSNAYVLKLTAAGSFAWVSPFIAKTAELSTAYVNVGQYRRGGRRQHRRGGLVSRPDRFRPQSVGRLPVAQFVVHRRIRGQVVAQWLAGVGHAARRWQRRECDRRRCHGRVCRRQLQWGLQPRFRAAGHGWQRVPSPLRKSSHRLRRRRLGSDERRNRGGSGLFGRHRRRRHGLRGRVLHRHGRLRPGSPRNSRVDQSETGAYRHVPAETAKAVGRRSERRRPGVADGDRFADLEIAVEEVGARPRSGLARCRLTKAFCRFTAGALAAGRGHWNPCPLRLGLRRCDTAATYARRRKRRKRVRWRCPFRRRDENTQQQRSLSRYESDMPFSVALDRLPLIEQEPIQRSFAPPGAIVGMGRMLESASSCALRCTGNTYPGDLPYAREAASGDCRLHSSSSG